MLPTFPTHRRALAVLASGAVAAGLAVAVTLGSTAGPRPGLVAGTPTGEQPSPTLTPRPRIAPAPPVSTAAPEVPAAGPAPAGGQSQPRTTSAPRSAPTTRARPPSRPTAIKPSPTPRAAPAPRPKPKPKPAPRPPSATAGPTGWGALNGAISRIPDYRSSGITWTVTSRYGHYGTTDLATSDIYISPNVPVSLLDSVVRHEYAHVVTVRVYEGQWRVAKSALNAAFGGSGMTGAERAADCMARLMGASWTNYTSCSSSSWRRNAELLLAGRRI